MNKFEWALVSVLIVLVSPLQSAFATWCGKPSACEITRTADVVFVGTPKSIEERSDGIAVNQFIVDEVFRGALGTEVNIVSEKHRFSVGEKYFVVGYRGTEGQFESKGECNPSTPSQWATGHIKFLREHKNGNSFQPVLYGIVARRVQSAPERMDVLEPLHGIAVEARSEDQIFRAVSDDDGYYEFKDIIPGKYELTAQLPSTLADRSTNVTVNSNACTLSDFVTEWNGRIDGYVSLANGQPVADADVNLMKIGMKDGDGIVGRTDDVGYYNFDHVQPGKYVIQLLGLDTPSEDYPFPPLFYPDQTEREAASIIEIGPGQLVSNANFRVPYFEPHLVIVKATWPNGKKIANAHVFVEYAQSYCWHRACPDPFFTTNESGLVEVPVFGNGRVRVYATAMRAPGQYQISQFQEFSAPMLRV